MPGNHFFNITKRRTLKSAAVGLASSLAALALPQYRQEPMLSAPAAPAKIDKSLPQSKRSAKQETALNKKELSFSQFIKDITKEQRISYQEILNRFVKTPIYGISLSRKKEVLLNLAQIAQNLGLRRAIAESWEDFFGEKPPAKLKQYVNSNIVGSVLVKVLPDESSLYLVLWVHPIDTPRRILSLEVDADYTVVSGNTKYRQELEASSPVAQLSTTLIPKLPQRVKKGDKVNVTLKMRVVDANFEETPTIVEHYSFAIAPSVTNRQRGLRAILQGKPDDSLANQLESAINFKVGRERVAYNREHKNYVAPSENKPNRSNLEKTEKDSLPEGSNIRFNYLGREINSLSFLPWRTPLTNSVQGDFDFSDKSVLLTFSASWCAPCKMMEPLVKQFAKDNPGVVVLEVFPESPSDHEGIEDKAKANRNIHYAIAPDKTLKELNIEGFPTFLLVVDGKIVWATVGASKGALPSKDFIEKVSTP
ncbi:MAG: thioredoxin [Candidatus Dadabacteria bacterium]|nr:MAG: thioredoxin [Candidatus Dadabacteria bacterium]